MFKLPHTQRKGPLRYLAPLLFFASSPSFASISQSHERIEIEGAAIDRPSHQHSGQRQIIAPESPSLFDARLYFQQQSSFLLEETSHVSSTGFSVPRVRGQGLELTEVYLEDLQLFDAYSGLPLLAELDLRAFGALELSKGLAPAKLSSLNPIGALRYRLLPSHFPGNRLGLEYGEPYGTSIWFRNRWLISKEQNVHTQIFGRYHESDGRFPYYDHRGTPYNTSDDRISFREQNARQSWQVMPMVYGENARHSWQVLGWLQEVHQEVPSLNSQRPSEADEYVEFSLFAASWQTRLPTDWQLAPDLFQVQLRMDSQEREFSDPTRLFLESASNSQMEVGQGSISLSGEWLSGIGGSYHKLEFLQSQAEVSVRNDSDLDLKLRRQRQQLYWGGLWPIATTWHLTLKAQYFEHSDRFLRQESRQHRVLGAHHARKQGALGLGLGLSWKPAKAWQLYGQWSQYERPPSILEEFGNGGGVAGNPKLKPEDLEHRELGIKWQSQAWGLSAYAAIFQDKMENKIVLIPRFENALIANNIGRSQVQGFEWGASWSPLQNVDLSINETRIQANDTSNPQQSFAIPGIPEQVRTASASWRTSELFVKMWVRHQGRFFRDQRNARKVPGSTLLDLTGDLRLTRYLGLAWGELEFSWQLLNLLDVKSLKISSQGAELSQEGRIPLSSFDGAPQPGRHFKLALTWTY